MILLALLLLAAVVALVVGVVLDGGESVAFDVFTVGVDTPLWGVFAGGVGTGLVALTGVIALVAGIRRARERRREIEYLRRKVAQHERAAGSDDDQEPRDWIGQSAAPDRSGTPGASGTVGGSWMPDPNTSSRHASP
ncbi:hypothetical protein CLV30_12116 [Haloactinopolyspora alba]|uniref:Uncharacterized protein n=1 Tax=Haloactinopolyspora alba TaxID=648780 RepID=A0A2P8DKW5_9ACTN|nr:hypothetical protein [Haloactinopolyspora alba]PSK97860.1 hypothetical protein CLV30_12116 [Haloactinopolyspora alba]